MSVDPTGTLTGGIDIDAAEGFADQQDLQADLTDLFVAVGEAAKDANRGLVLLFDEVQFLSTTQLEALISALHKTVQRGLPVTMVGAGLPQIAELAGDAKSYSERLFKFPRIGNLDDEDARAALVKPAQDEGADYSEVALDLAVEITGGYPYFLQELGYAVWVLAGGPVITEEDVSLAVPTYEAKLDESFFSCAFGSRHRVGAHVSARDGRTRTRGPEGAGCGRRHRTQVNTDGSHPCTTDQHGTALHPGARVRRVHRAAFRQVPSPGHSNAHHAAGASQIVQEEGLAIAVATARPATIPLGEVIVLRVKNTWPRTSKIYCHPHGEPRPEDADIVEELTLRSCVRRGAAISIEVDRTRESRSQFVITQARGREMIFWQSARTSKVARPNVAIPTARASGVADMEIVVDTRERYAWKFTTQQATTTKQALKVGDYGVKVDDELIAVVERKSLTDFAGSLTSGKLEYRLADLEQVPRAVVLVEDRYSAIFKLEHVRPAVVADMLAECQVRHRSVPIIFAETRALTQEWAYRFFGAAVRDRQQADESVTRW